MGSELTRNLIGLFVSPERYCAEVQQKNIIQGR